MSGKNGNRSSARSRSSAASSSWNFEDLKAEVQRTYALIDSAEDHLEVKKYDLKLKAIRVWCDVDRAYRAAEEIEELRVLVKEAEGRRDLKHGGFSLGHA